MVLLAVKDTQNDGAAAWLARLCDADTVVCVLQNGVEQVERVGRYCPAVDRRARRGVVLGRDPARWLGPATHPGAVGAARRRAGRERLAETLRGPRCRGVQPGFRHRGLAQAADQRRGGPDGADRPRSGMFRRDDVAAPGAATTSPNASRWRGPRAPNLDDAVIGEIVGMFAGLPEDMTTSILTDREQGRPMEWDVRNGVIARKAALHGLATPISDVLVPLLAAADEGPG